MPTIDELEATKDAIEKAHRMVVSLCRREIEWRMTIPVDENRDPDVVIYSALTIANRIIHQLETENAKLRKLVDALRPTVQDWDD